ncbi:motility protein A [Colidextribacter sp. OB.20]|uniref:motility protein A n=1 Tax=Colidextribacter sp. OB.20 TaxID=2304568 RepID=UPI00136E9A2B|nr:MotA/TolQ/ExbB proton channel family protein [Colidextribacter sp. OB.20]NBI10011.1 motility protein A [Colidextribacter sp. OB.20]
MNITYIIGVIAAFGVMVIGMMQGGDGGFLTPGQIMNFVDGASVFITIGCTFAVLIASFPIPTLAAIPKHLAVLMNTKKYDPMAIIERLVELAQVARKNGLLALEEMGNQESDPFFKQCIMLVVDNNDADQAREIMMNDIEQSSARHEDAAGMYDRASSVAPAFGMVGTLVGLINMLKGMDVSGDGASSIGTAMGTALITTLYGCVLAHMIFGPIATQLRQRDEEETLCKLIIVEGIMSIQAGANPKFLREKLLTFLSQKQRSDDGGGKKGKKGDE